MRRLGFLLVGLVVLSAATKVSVDRNGYLLGQADVRAFEDYLQPGVCGIVLERPQCSQDDQIITAAASSSSFNKEAQQWLLTGDIAYKPTAWNGIEMTPSGWAQNPLFATSFVAGAITFASALPKSQASSDYAGSMFRLLTQHKAAVPAWLQLSAATGADDFDRARGVAGFLNAQLPIAAYPAISFSPGGAGDAQLGVYGATFQELVDNPFALSRPDARAFAIAVLKRMEQVATEEHFAFNDSAMLSELNGEISSDPQVLDSTFREPMAAAAAMFKNDPARRDAFITGTMAAQAAYNAAVLKDLDSDRLYKGFISQTKPYAGMSERVSTSLKAMVDVAPGSWSATNSAATAATNAIISNP